MVRRQILLALAVLASSYGAVQAQSAFPAPLPGADPPASLPPATGDGRAFGVVPLSAPPQAAWPFPAAPQSECVDEFLPLRQVAERRGQLIRETSARHASAAEACKLLNEFVTAEVRVLKYVQAKSAVCGIPSNILDQLNTGHQHAEQMRTRICNAAVQKPEPAGIVTDFGDPAFKSPGLFKIAPESPSKEGTWLFDGLRMR